MNIKEKILNMTTEEAIDLLDTDEKTIWFCGFSDKSVSDRDFDYWCDYAIDHAEMIMAGNAVYIEMAARA